MDPAVAGLLAEISRRGFAYSLVVDGVRSEVVIPLLGLGSAQAPEAPVEEPEPRSDAADEGFVHVDAAPRSRDSRESRSTSPTAAPSAAPAGPRVGPPPEAFIGLERLVPLGGLSPRARICRAFRLGADDGEQVGVAEGGGRPRQVSEQLPGQRTSAYVVLRPPGGGAPQYTRTPDRYFGVVRPRGVWLPDSVSRAFGTQAEARAYALGAGLAELPEES